nr:hypothetical protein [Candidatus Cloacimonadota bacterium]
MSETKKNTKAKTTNLPPVADKHKVSLVELIMILLLVGLVCVFIFGMKQLRVDKEIEAIAYQKFQDVLPVLQEAVDAAEEFRLNDEFSEYPFDFGQLNMTSTDSYTVETSDNGEIYLQTDDFTIKYDGNDYSFIITSKEEFGKAGIEVIYSLPNHSYQIEDPNPGRRPTIKDEWLPKN